MTDSAILTVGVSQPLNEKVHKRVYLSPLNEKVTSECFAAQNAIITVGDRKLSPIFSKTVFQIIHPERIAYMNLRFYEIDNQYIDYLSAFEPHFFHRKQPEQQNERKYIGILLQIHRAWIILHLFLLSSPSIRK